MSNGEVHAWDMEYVCDLPSPAKNRTMQGTRRGLFRFLEAEQEYERVRYQTTECGPHTMNSVTATPRYADQTLAIRATPVIPKFLILVDNPLT